MLVTKLTKRMRNTPLWFKGGIASLLFFLFMTLLVNPSLNSFKNSSGGYLISQVVGAPMLLLSLPLYLLFSYVGFALDAIFNTGVGYESLGEFPVGIFLMKFISLTYFFLIGVLFVILYKKVRSRKQPNK